MGHTGSVKSLCPHPSNPGKFLFSPPFIFFISNLPFKDTYNFFRFSIDLVASGSRDGSFAIWDLRGGSRTRRGDMWIP